jgi:hypothetical protein
VDDALLARGEIEKFDAEIPAIFFQGDHHLLRQAVGVGAVRVVRRNDVVHGGEGPLRAGHAQALFADHLKGLGARDLVDQMEPDEQLRLAVRQFPDGVQIPDFIEQCFSHDHIPWFLAAGRRVRAVRILLRAFK